MCKWEFSVRAYRLARPWCPAACAGRGSHCRRAMSSVLVKLKKPRRYDRYVDEENEAFLYEKFSIYKKLESGEFTSRWHMLHYTRWRYNHCSIENPFIRSVIRLSTSYRYCRSCRVVILWPLVQYQRAFSLAHNSRSSPVFGCATFFSTRARMSTRENYYFTSNTTIFRAKESDTRDTHTHTAFGSFPK